MSWESIRKEILRRAYNNIVPRSYDNAISRIWNGIVLNKDTSNGELASTRRDALAALYFQIPENERHSAEGRTNNGGIHLSSYKPKRGNQNEDYYALDLSKREKAGVVQAGITTPLNTTRLISEKNSPKLYRISGLLDFGISHGYDPTKGEYVSYTDTWDLSPISLNPFHHGIKSNHNGINDSIIGQPFNVYDRIYLDDYYHMPEESKGSYFLPEVSVTPNETKVMLYVTENTPIWDLGWD